MNPFVGLGLAQVELESMRRLERIRFLIDQNEEQLISACSEAWLVSASRFSLSESTGTGVSHGVHLGGFFQERGKQSLKLGYGQTRHAEKSAGTLFQSGIGYHAPQYTLFPIKSNV